MTIEEILDMMDGLLEKSTAVPFSNKKVIDFELMREYIDSIRMNMPVEISKAKDTERDQKSIISEANKAAEQIIRKAEERAKAIISQEEIIKQSREIAKEQLQRAKEEADNIIEDAKNKERNIKAALAANLEKTLIDAEKVLSKSLSDVTATKDAVLKVGGK